MKTILIADDNPDVRRLIRATFDKNFEVYEAENGQMALDKIRVIRPDIVFLDVMMPGELNGLQVLSAVREDPNIRHTAVYMVTGRDDYADYCNAQRHEADGYIAKPFSTAQLIIMVKDKLAKEM